MSQSRVDGIEVAWESQERRFRVCVFDGPDATLRDYEFNEWDSAGEMLERAVGLARGNRSLWSVALRVNDQSNAPGLVWLEGMDYRQQPRTRLEWRARGSMQDRYLRARAERGEDLVLPSGLRVIRMFGDYGRVLPLWENFTRGAYTIDRGQLPLSDELENGLEAWQRAWHETGGGFTADTWASQLANAWSLHAQLQLELQGIAEVRPEFF